METAEVLFLLLNTSMLWNIVQAGKITFFVETGIELDESSISCHYHEQLCSVPSVRPTDQNYLLPGHEYEELRGL